MEKQLQNIILLSEDETLNSKRLKKLYDKSADMMIQLSDTYDNAGKLTRILLLLSNTAVVVLRTFLQEHRDTQRRERVTSRVFDIPAEQVTGDLTSFITADTNMKVYVNDFQYDASIPLRKMAAVKLIWGDCNLRKLHDFQWTNSLEVTMGNIYTSDTENLDGFHNLKVVTGDLHLEGLEQLPTFENLIYVGGKVYCQDGIKTLEELKGENNKTKAKVM